MPYCRMLVLTFKRQISAGRTCRPACGPTLFTVTVPPVQPASGAPEKAPGSDPAVRVATVIVFSYTFAWVALLKAGHIGPVHAPLAGLGYVYRSAVETVFSAALDAGREGQDEWGSAAGAAVLSHKRQHQRQKEQTVSHVHSPVLRGRNRSFLSHQLRRSSDLQIFSCGRTVRSQEGKNDADQSNS